MAETENQSLTPVYLDRNTTNIQRLQEIMAREKGIVSLRNCVLAAIDYFVVNHNKNGESNQAKTANGQISS